MGRKSPSSSSSSQLRLLVPTALKSPSFLPHLVYIRPHGTQVALLPSPLGVTRATISRAGHDGVRGRDPNVGVLAIDVRH